MSRSDASGFKRFHGWTNRRLRRLGAPFVCILPEVALDRTMRSLPWNCECLQDSRLHGNDSYWLYAEGWQVQGLAGLAGLGFGENIGAGPEATAESQAVLLHPGSDG